MFPDDSKRIQKFSLYDSITHVHMVGQFVLSVMSLVISTYAYDACGYPQYVYGHYVVMSGSFLFASLMFVSYYCAPRRIRWYHLAGLKLNLLAGGILLMGLSVALGVTGFACELQGFRTDWGRNQIARKCLAGIFPGYQLHNPNCPASMVSPYQHSLK